MFQTGIFSFMDGTLHTVQNIHTENKPYNDDVLSWYNGLSKSLFELTNKCPADGGVSNEGSVVTIHITPECNTEENIKSVKTFFHLYKKEGVTEVIVKEI